MDKEKFKKESKERLRKIAAKKIQTTMVGAVAAIEEIFGELLDKNPDLEPLFNDLRKRILDNGNNQIRNLNEEFKHYDIEWLRYTIVLPYKPRGNE